MAEGMIGDLMDKDVKAKKLVNSRMWRDVIKVVNMPPDQKAAYHRKVAIQMQNDIDRDTIEFKKRIKYKHVTKSGKEVPKYKYKAFSCKIRKNEAGEEIMFARGKTSARLRGGLHKTDYNLVKDKDGLEHLVLRKEVLEELDLDKIPF